MMIIIIIIGRRLDQRSSRESKGAARRMQNRIGRGQILIWVACGLALWSGRPAARNFGLLELGTGATHHCGLWCVAGGDARVGGAESAIK